MKSWYKVLNMCEDTKHEIDASDFVDDSMLAEIAAEDFFDNHNGWKCSWPLIFTIHDTEDGDEALRFVVDCTSTPAFTVTQIEQEDEDESL